jgi:hypothetical protein
MARMWFRKQRNMQQPLFFSYLGLVTVANVVLLAILRAPAAQYFYVYWTMSTLIMLFGFGVLYEVFVNILKPYSAVIDLGKMLFCWAAIFLLVASFLTALVTSGPKTSKIVVCIELLDRCVHLMQCGMLLLLVLFEKRLNLSWKSSSMTVALGLGLTAAVDLLMSYAQGRLPAVSAYLEMVNGLSFLAVLGYWALRLGSPEPARSTAAESPSRLILQRWNEALVGYGYGDVAFASNAGDSFLPGVERTVDRVLARKIVH